jgi:hypothetical protein
LARLKNGELPVAVSRTRAENMQLAEYLGDSEGTAGITTNPGEQLEIELVFLLSVKVLPLIDHLCGFGLSKQSRK